jgi:hypothetical protein
LLVLAMAFLLGSVGAAGVSFSLNQRELLQTPGNEEDRAGPANIWSQEGIRLFSEGKYGGAARAFEKVYALYPENPDVALPSPCRAWASSSAQSSLC